MSDLRGKIVNVESAFHGVTGWVDRDSLIGIVISVLDEPSALLKMKNGAYQQFPLSNTVLATDEQTVDYWQHRAHEAEHRLHQAEQEVREAKEGD